jgi:serralysin
MIAPVNNKPFTNRLVYIDGILWGGKHWDQDANDGKLEYSFWSGKEAALFDDGIDNGNGNIAGIADKWTKFEKSAMELALQLWANVADLNFVKVAPNTTTATLSFYKTELGGTILGLFNPPGEPGMGIGYFDNDWKVKRLHQGGFDFITLIHELGHGLGLAHPHDNGGGSSVFPGVKSAFGDKGVFGLNQGVWTVMSYNDGLLKNKLKNSSYGYEGTPMALDIAAVQYLYGANDDYRTGDDVYQLPTANKTGTFYSCLWDAGGVDEISNAGGDRSSVINLNEAPLAGAFAGGFISSVSKIYGGFTIANGVVIENATGGRKDDLILGNSSENSLRGNQGDDILAGAYGDDELIGQDGTDFLLGSVGNDVLDGGDGADYLLGAAGDDILTGGADRDRFFYITNNQTFTPKTFGLDTIQDFDSGQDKIVLSKTAFSELNSKVGKGFSKEREFAVVLNDALAELSDAKIVFSQETGGLFYNSNGSRSGFAKGNHGGQFATLTGVSSLDANDFEIVASQRAALQGIVTDPAFS